MGKTLEEYVVKSGIDKKRVHSHVFRATKAVLFLRNGGDFLNALATQD